MKLSKDKLAGMSKEQKLKLLDLIEEKKRRDRLRPNKYTPNAGQLPVHLSSKPNRFVFSSNSAGKTCMLVNETIWAAEGYNPILKEYTKVPCRIIVVLDQPVKVAEAWLPEIRKWTVIDEEQLHKDGKPYISRISFPNGSNITFAFHDQDPMRFESIEVDVVVMDEPLPKPIFTALQRGGRTKGRKGRYLFGGTPIAAPWLRTEIWEPWSRGERDDIECFRSSVEVNKQNLADGFIEQFGKFLTEKEKAIRLKGEFADLEGLALAGLFNRNTHLVAKYIREEFRENHWPCVVAIDPHPEKKTHAVLMGVRPEGRLVLLEEIARKETPRDFAESLKEMSRDYRVIDWVCDNFGSGQFTGGDGFKSFIQVVNDSGLRVRATSYDEKQDDAFIERIQDALHLPESGIPKLQIVEDCRGTITDIEQVEWLKVKHMDLYKPKLNIGNKDYLACLKYALATNLRFNKTNSTIISTTRPVSWAERNQPTATDRRFSRAQVKRNYTDGRNKAPDEDF